MYLSLLTIALDEIGHPEIAIPTTCDLADGHLRAGQLDIWIACHEYTSQRPQ